MKVQPTNQIGMASVSLTERVEGGGEVYVPVAPAQMEGGADAFAGQESKKEVSKEELEKALKSMNKFLENNGTYLQFKRHDKLNEFYVQVVDKTSNEVISEIPSKRMLDVYAEMLSTIGLLVDQKA